VNETDFIFSYSQQANAISFNHLSLIVVKKIA